MASSTIVGDHNTIVFKVVESPINMSAPYSEQAKVETQFSGNSDMSCLLDQYHGQNT
jgi:hypothetical protein